MAADLAPDEAGYMQAMAAWGQQREDQYQENKRREFFDAAKYRTQTATGIMADGVVLGNPELVKDAAMMPNAAGANLWNDPVEGPRLKGWYMRATTQKTKGITLRQKQDDERLIDAAKKRGSTFTFDQLDQAIGTEGGPSTVSAANTILETQLAAKLGFQQLDGDVTLIAGGNIMDIPPGPERQNRVNLATADLYENLVAGGSTPGQSLGAVQLGAALDGTTVDWISTRANAMVESGTAADMEDAVLYKKTMAAKPGLYSSTLSHVNLAAITHYEYLVGQFGDDQNGHKKAATTLQNFKPDAREARKALQKDANWRDVHEPAILRDHSFMDLEEIKDRAAFHHAGGLDVATSVSLAVGSMEKEQSVDEHGIVMRKATYTANWEEAPVRQRVRETFLTDYMTRQGIDNTPEFWNVPFVDDDHPSIDWTITPLTGGLAILKDENGIILDQINLVDAVHEAVLELQNEERAEQVARNLANDKRRARGQRPLSETGTDVNPNVLPGDPNGSDAQ
jgi:hypothetical protein